MCCAKQLPAVATFVAREIVKPNAPTGSTNSGAILEIDLRQKARGGCAE
jgi:hypothetical protein